MCQSKKANIACRHLQARRASPASFEQKAGRPLGGLQQLKACVTLCTCIARTGPRVAIQSVSLHKTLLILNYPASRAQCWLHWIVLMSMPSWTISHRGLISRNLSTCSTVISIARSTYTTVGQPKLKGSSCILPHQ